jgi:hypothetical protein
MKTPFLFITTSLLSCGQLFAAEGASPDWNEVAAADHTLMGDYEGEWLDAPKGHYFDINKPLAAQVINVRNGDYHIRLFQQHDKRADLYFEGSAKLEGDVIRFSEVGWNGTISKDGFTGTSGQASTAIQFQLKKTIRSSPTLGAKPPAGAIVLFDGKNFDEWQHGGNRPVSWNLLENGAMEIRSARSDEDRKQGIGGDIMTKKNFGDCKIHLEFRYPVEPGKAGQGRGNSGFFFQKDYEVQILNSYGLDGNWNECGALYKTSPPHVNAARPPMEWQTYDIDYKASVWKDGKKISPPRITVRHNGVLIHHDEEIPHATSHTFAGRLVEPQGEGPIRLQDHNNAIQFRNIWVIPGK